MSTPTEPKRNNWAFPAFILWGVAPAILMVLGAVVDQNKRHDLGGGFMQLGFFGMPVILYAWSVAFLRWRGTSPGGAYGFGVLLTILMCVVNLAVAAAGCSALTGHAF